MVQRVNRVIVGNALIGDTFTMWGLCREECEVVCNRYNEGAVRVLREVVGLPIKHVEIKDDWDMAMGETHYRPWREKWGVSGWGPEMVGHGRNPDLSRFPEMERERTNLVTVQLESAREYKNFSQVGECLRGRRDEMVTFTMQEGEKVGVELRGLDLVTVARVMLKARAHVGISSSLSLLAYMLGVETLMVFSRPELVGLRKTWVNVGENLRVMDMPSREELENGINQILGV